MDVTKLREMLKAHHQEHLLKYWDDPEISDQNRRQLHEDLMDIDLGGMNAAFKMSTGISVNSNEQNENIVNGVTINGASNGASDISNGTNNDIPVNEKMEPLQDELCASIRNSSVCDVAEFRKTTLGHIAKGHVGILLLAGGQGTRLGVPYPKGRSL